mmetsp:Transcript_17149/g.24133  ORF Transcript_17149/g.24133 Transcript_17149/m.24133 type:complete len:82 (-) Transcript_17149:57-302(-)
MPCPFGRLSVKSGGNWLLVWMYNADKAFSVAYDQHFIASTDTCKKDQGSPVISTSLSVYQAAGTIFSCNNNNTFCWLIDIF